jgi:predicted Zn-dependent protease
VKTYATKRIVPAVLIATATVVCAAETDRATTTHDTQEVAMALSITQTVRRVEPPADLRFNHSRAVQFIERSRFTQEDREKMRAFHDEFMATGNTPLPAEVACPHAQRYAQSILDRLIDASGLRQAMLHADFPVQLVVTCGVADFPDAEIKAGVLEVSAELLLALSSEDEIAAMMGHELAHYTLAHEAKKLEVHARLTPYAARALSIDHELEADTEGLILLANAGYDPYAAVDALQVMRAIVHARSLQTDAAHPDLGDRIRHLERQISQAGLNALPRRTRGLAAAQDELRRRPLALLKRRESMH